MEIWRGGDTSRYVGQDHISVSLVAAGAHSSDDRKGARFGFVMRVPHGRTRVHLWIPPAKFKQLAKVMMRADPEGTQRAFLEAMLGRMPRAKKKKKS
jgi:hypothetical protein